jgi:hypothetical protein
MRSTLCSWLPTASPAGPGALILNGSRSQKALGWEWDKLPDYGRLRHLTADHIARKVDWCIHHRWLRFERLF